ncbi:tRNA modification GTPase MnmE [Candidatus Clavichlamydia salmonicola]|uniref:tRNA uridine-5-carboxymethylaminomethyl(34) synthesis GTPase MnmE n=1 Tax=Candidatus Clavichlamydia salmonicola TaxID=469812 RepID=UPI00189181B0|nr:tRNA uridine-5-carboxymethylaminomethyl(34) synthesis GTPase MnmE [Candidatus Clavichlamydia salmonicola]MBF5050553.1 tRNA modification GTPase MnmE [Candidatus Clavichlamydia salmonicola]
MALFSLQDTIAALATAPGEGGVAIVRISGPNSINIAEKVFSGMVSSFPSHTVNFGKILLEDGSVIDSGLLLVMKNPNSYTGEDIVEIQCHGGHFTSHNILNHLFKLGVRQASPGEFTFRAFINGKMDLSQAEAVQQLVCAKNSLAAKFAHRQLEGSLSKKILFFQKNITSILVISEAFLDFPEDDIDFHALKDAKNQLNEIITSIKELLGTFDTTRKISQGFIVGIIGAPNVGKSSLMNTLLEKNRAIVTPIAGTTRDTIEEEFLLEGRLLKLTDTAGIREIRDPIEEEGIQRSKQVEQEADIILWVVDASQQELTNSEKILFHSLDQKKTLLLMNKSDLLDTPTTNPAQSWTGKQLSTSTLTKNGLSGLKQEIANFVNIALHQHQNHTACLVSHRHFLALTDALIHLEKAYKEINHGAFEITAADLRCALAETGKIIGTDVTETILSEIFSRFCIGK